MAEISAHAHAHSDSESDGQWDVLSVSATSEPEDYQSVLGRGIVSADVHSDHFLCPVSPASAPLDDLRGDELQVWADLSSQEAQEDFVAVCQEVKAEVDSSDLQSQKHESGKDNLDGFSAEFYDMKAFLSPTKIEGLFEEGRICRSILPPVASSTGGAISPISKHTALSLEFPSILEEEFFKKNPFDQQHHTDVDEFVRHLIDDKRKLICEGVSDEKATMDEHKVLLMKSNSNEKLNSDKADNLAEKPSTTDDEHEWCVRQAQAQAQTHTWRAQARAGQMSPVWSIALAAAVMGLFILGQKWQQERHQNQHLQMQLCVKDEVLSFYVIFSGPS